jgi:hypothetical protein
LVKVKLYSIIGKKTSLKGEISTVVDEYAILVVSEGTGVVKDGLIGRQEALGVGSEPMLSIAVGNIVSETLQVHEPWIHAFR